MKESIENLEEISENKKEKIIENNKEINNINNHYIICHDQTIIEVSDKKWSRFLI